MTLPASLAQVLPPTTRRAWERVAPLVPERAYLVGGTAIAVHLGHRLSRDLDFFLESPEDLHALADDLVRLGTFVPTTLREDTLNGFLDDAKLQFLLADTQRVIEPMTVVAGIRIAGVGDLLATKLKVVGDRGELRDYFDIMTIEARAGRRVEEGLALFVARYAPQVPDAAVLHIVRGLGYLGDVANDPQLPVKRASIERYWHMRQPEIVRNLDRQAAVFSRPGEVKPEKPTG